MADEQEFLFVVPEPDVVPASAEPPWSGEGGESAEADVSIIPRLPFMARAREVSITRAQLEDFWRQKVVGLTETLAGAQRETETEGFRVDEISFSIGVGAKGGVAFVAEGSVTASMNVTLRRTGPPAQA